MSHQHLATTGILAREAMEHTRHQPEQTLLYQVIEEHYPEFLSHLIWFFAGAMRFMP